MEEDKENIILVDPEGNSLTNYLRQSSRCLYPVCGDGNCMFRCLSYHLVGSEDVHLAVRSLLTRYVNLNSQSFEPYIMNNSTISDHITKMLRPSTWARQVEILAAASLFQVSVYELVQSQDCESHHWEVHHPLALSGQFKQVRLEDEDPLQTAVIPPHFELLYRINSHYDCIINQETNVVCKEPPQISSTHTHIDLTS